MRARGLELLSLLLLAGLADCSSNLCVQVDAVPDAQQTAAATAPCAAERIGAFSVATRSLDPGLGEMVALRSMTDAAVLAGHLTRSADTVLTDPPPNAAALQSLQGARKAWDDVLARETVVLDHHRALAELGLRLADDLEATRPDAVAFAARDLLDGWVARRERILTDAVGTAATSLEAAASAAGQTPPASTQTTPSDTPPPNETTASSGGSLPPPRVSSRPRTIAPRSLPAPAVVVVRRSTVARGP